MTLWIENLQYGVLGQPTEEGDNRKTSTLSIQIQRIVIRRRIG